MEASECSVGTASAEDDEEADSDENDEEKNRHDDLNDDASLAVRRVFLANMTCTSSLPAFSQDVDEIWTTEQFSCWLDRALDVVLAREDATLGARVFWREWTKIERHIPRDQRRIFVRLMDTKLQSRSFPSLRELVRLQDG